VQSAGYRPAASDQINCPSGCAML